MSEAAIEERPVTQARIDKISEYLKEIRPYIVENATTLVHAAFLGASEGAGRCRMFPNQQSVDGLVQALAETAYRLGVTRKDAVVDYIRIDGSDDDAPYASSRAREHEDLDVYIQNLTGRERDVFFAQFIEAALDVRRKAGDLSAPKPAALRHLKR